MHLVQDKAHVYRATHDLLGCHRLLPDREKPWQLCFDDSGLSFFACGDERLWGSKLFGATVIDIEGELYAVKSPEDVVELQHYRETNHNIEGFSIDVPLGQAHFKLVRFDRHWGGAYLFWCVTTLFALVKPSTKLKAKEWYKNWWTWWQKDFAKLGLDPLLHCRSPQETAAPKSRRL